MSPIFWKLWKYRNAKFWQKWVVYLLLEGLQIPRSGSKGEGRRLQGLILIPNKTLTLFLPFSNKNIQNKLPHRNKHELTLSRIGTRCELGYPSWPDESLSLPTSSPPKPSNKKVPSFLSHLFPTICRKKAIKSSSHHSSRLTTSLVGAFDRAQHPSKIR